MTISIHTDPNFEYPYFSGYANERGAGAGYGYHHNFPLSLGTSEAIYLETLDLALTELLKYTTGYLFLSARMDIYESDPLGKINVSRMGIAEVRRRIAALHIPIVILLEGGYNNEVLGEIVVALLGPFAN